MSFVPFCDAAGRLQAICSNIAAVQKLYCAPRREEDINVADFGM